MYTTLNAIRKHQPCTEGWETLLKYLGKIQPDNESLPLLTILESNGFEHALWCFRAVDGFEKEKLLLSVTYAREVEHLMPAESKKCLDVFERYANKLATKDEFDAARRTATAAWSAAYAGAAARDAAAAADAAGAAARAALASWVAADVAADASYAAVAHAAAHDADAVFHARSTIKAKQESQLRELLERTCIQP